MMSIGTSEMDCLGEDIINHIISQVSGLRSCALLDSELRRNKLLGGDENFPLTGRLIFGIGIRVRCPRGSKEAACKAVGSAYIGSNPILTTT